MVCDLVASEVYFALQYHFEVPKDEALRALAQFVASDYVECSGSAREVLAMSGLAKSNPGFVDRLIIGQARLADAPLITFEKASGKLEGVEVLR